MAVNLVVNDGKRRIRAERHAPDHQFVEDDAQRIQISARVEIAVAHRLFGRDVMRRAQQNVMAERAVAQLRHPCQPEVGHVRNAIVVDDDVRGLDVAVQHTLTMRVIERVANRRHQAQNLLDGQRRGVEFSLERASFDVLHDQIRSPIEFVNVEDRDNVRMLQTRDDLRFTLEAGEEVLVFLKGFVQHLDRDSAIQPGVVSLVDGRHPARTHLGDDFVLTERLSFERRHAHCPTAD